MRGKWAPQRLWRIPVTKQIGDRTANRQFHQTRGFPHHTPWKAICIPSRARGLVARHNYRQKARALVTSSIPPVLVPPLIFVGLLLTLWAWKCFWIILLQDKLLYLSWLPPFARSETIASYEAECRPIKWDERCIRSLDGTKLTVCEGRIRVTPDDHTSANSFERGKKSIVICYFQGNGGSTPLRLPLLSQFLRTLKDQAISNKIETIYTVVALSYRGYWTSSGRATQSGIELDAQALLKWVSETYSEPNTELQIILWGHSLGAAVASTATVTYLSDRDNDTRFSSSNAILATAPRLPPIAGLILEAPISSIKGMLVSLYPQKWLPYRYLWPFSWNNWSIPTAMEQMACWRDRKISQRRLSVPENGAEKSQSANMESEAMKAPSVSSLPPILLLSAEQDEVIPPWVGDQLERKAKDLELPIERKNISGAMHIEVPLKLDGRQAIVNFILQNTSRGVGTGIDGRADKEIH